MSSEQSVNVCSEGAPLKVDSAKVDKLKKLPFWKNRKRLHNAQTSSKSGDFAGQQPKQGRSLMAQERLPFPFLVRLNGLFALCESVYSALSSRDRFIQTTISLSLLYYISYSCAYIRLLLLDCSRGRSLSNMQVFRDLYHSVMLPQPIADYISSLGKTSLPTGLEIIPTTSLSNDYCYDNLPAEYSNPLPFMLVMWRRYQTWRDDGFPLLPDPEEEIFSLVTLADYGISGRVFSKYIEICGRMMKCGRLRILETSLDGTLVTVISVKEWSQNGLVPRGPFPAEEGLARRGAAYRFQRDVSNNTRPFENQVVCCAAYSGYVVDSSTILTELARGVLRDIVQ